MRVVLDANIFVSGVINPRGTPAALLRAWRNEQFFLLASPSILKEIERVFAYPKIFKRLYWTKSELSSFIKELGDFSIQTSGNMKIDFLKSDPSDNRYLECAMEGDADAIVSGDRHLLDLKAFRGISIFSALDFLSKLKGIKH